MKETLFKILFWSFLLSPSTGYSQNTEFKEFKHVLYIHSYAPGYSWDDSITKGVLQTFKPHPNVILYFEYLDAKRFGDKNFNLLFELIKRKYKHFDIDLIIANDNKALDFLMEYGDSIAPNVPIVFCGINNPEDYNFENTRFYGIEEGVDQDLVNQLILKIIPNVKKFYFITDSTATSLVNLKYIKKLEPKYKDKIQFEYFHNLSVDSLMKLVPTLEKGNAIARIDVFIDDGDKPVNSDVILQQIAKISPVPIFMDAHTSLGKGILGGISNNGVNHGADMAKLALEFLENTDFKPKQRVTPPIDHYYFDYNIIVKYNINPDLLPEDAVIINAPTSIFFEYIEYIIGTLTVIAFLIFTIVILSRSINRRKKAELRVQQNLEEIKEKNQQLREVNQVVNDMNAELEETNSKLKKTNLDLIDAKQKAEESERLKSAFLANMSHEIRTPMNAIVGFSSLLVEEGFKKQERERFSQLINQSGQQLLNLIDDILDLSKSEAELLKLNARKIPIKELIDELVGIFRQRLTSSNIKLITANCASNNDLFIKSDPVRLKQILSNFISNAVKFTEKGQIEIGCTTNNHEIVFFVKDTGIGIEKQHQELIFDRFWKLETTKSKLYPGTGLGLAISKKLSELLGGKIWVESEPGKGSTFYLSLNSEHFSKTTASTHKEHQPKPPISNKLEGFTIAIAEDEEVNLQLLTLILEKHKLKVMGFCNGQKIVNYFKNKELKEPIHLVLMDIKMPEMDGYEALEQIKKIEPNLPIIAQTAYALKEDIRKMEESEFDDYLIKPIKPALLMEKIEKFLVINNNA